jgi:hypothetical protein
MAFIGGRWEKTRYISEEGISDPFFWDRKCNKLIPADKDLWWKSKDGIWYPIVSGGVDLGGWNQPVGLRMLYEDMDTSATLANHLLNSNFVVNTSGDGVAFAGAIPEDKTLSSWFYRVNTITGTPGVVTVYIQTDNGSGVPDGSNLFTTTSNPSATLGWHEITGINLALTAGTIYWFMIGDTAGDGSNNYRINTANNALGLNRNIPSSFFVGGNTASGFSGGMTRSGNPTVVLYFSDGTAVGSPLAQFANPTNNALQRGLLISGMNVDFELFAVVLGQGNGGTDLTGINIWQSTTGPSGSPFASSDKVLVNSSNQRVGGVFKKPFPKLLASTQYRIVSNWGSANGDIPDKHDFGTVTGGGESRMAKAMIGGGSWYWTEESGGVWVDDTEAFPRIGLWISDFLTTGGAGGAGNTRAFPIIPNTPGATRIFPLVPTS